MDNLNTKEVIPTKARIGAIDSVRALILLGILIVHTSALYSFKIPCVEDLSIFDQKLILFTDLFLKNKCAIVFNVLFGVSFYFILKKPDYPASKFVWRCVLLFGFGLFNKMFYSFDALCWYAIWGIVLVLFRNCSVKMLIIYIIILKLLAYYLSFLGLGDYIPERHRYDFEYPLTDIIFYKYSLIDYLHVVVGSGIFGGISNFLIGYLIGRLGWIEKLSTLVSKRVLYCTFIIYVITFSINRYFYPLHIFLSLFAGLFYSCAIIYAYYHIAIFKRPLTYLEAYGKLGLTNYSFQGIFGVVFIYYFGLSIINNYSYSALLGIMLLFYLCQVIFSVFWLKKHKFGPLEYLWRSITNRKFAGNIK